ncbi:MAG: hypothetical protein WC133_06250 [Candidatus Omnitrophota bacterium]
MKSRSLINILIIVCVALTLSGCVLTRYEVIPQADKGPQGGQMMRINQVGSGYVEFVAKSVSGSEWLLQVFGYDENMKPTMHYSSAKVEVVTPDAKKTFVTLWNTKPYFWNRGVGTLEGKVNIEGNVFKTHVKLIHGKSARHCIDFDYPLGGSAGTAK